MVVAVRAYPEKGARSANGEDAATEGATPAAIAVAAAVEVTVRPS